MHPHCRSRGSAGSLANVTFSAALYDFDYFSLPLFRNETSKSHMMKTDQTLSAIFRQLRPSLRQPHSAYSHSRPLSQLAPLRHPCFLRPSHTLKPSIPKSPFSPHIRRISGSTFAPSSAVARSQDNPSSSQSPPEKPPAYELTFTCKPCKHRSTHNITKHGYHKGTVLITCPECANRHLISDHLKVRFQPI